LAVSIRPVTDLEADWPALLELLKAFDAHHLAFLEGELRPNAYERVHARFTKGLAKGRMLILLAEDEGAAIGIASGAILKSPSMFEERVGYLNNFYIDEAHRGSTLILSFHRLIEDWFRAQGATVMQRSVYVANERTYALWQRMGFKPYVATLRKPLKP